MKLITKKCEKGISLKNSDGIQLLKDLKENSVDCIITDPPYKTTARGNAGTSGGMLQKEICKKGQMFNYNNLSPNDYAPYMFRCLKDGGHCYIMTNHVNLIEMLNTFTSAGFHFIKSLIWDKGNKIMGKFYMSQFEYILFFRKGKAVQINNCGTSDILSVANRKTKNAEGKNLHDTQKPVELMSILIQNSTKTGELVVDPFAGIFTTAVACKQLERQFIGSEIDPTYYSLGVDFVRGAIK